MLTPDEAEAAYRTERAINAAEVARLRRGRRAGTRRRTADALRTLAQRIEPVRPQDPARAVSRRPQPARPRR